MGLHPKMAPLLLLKFARNVVLQIALAKAPSPVTFTPISFRNWRALFEKNARGDLLPNYSTTTSGGMYIAKEVNGKMEELGYDTALPDIAIFDNHLFRFLKEFLAKKNSSSKAIQQLGSQSPQFFKKGIADLLIKWETVVTKGDDSLVE